MTMLLPQPPLTTRYNFTLSALREQAWFPLLSNQQKLAHCSLLAETFTQSMIFLEIEAGIHPMARKKLNQFSTKFAAITLDAADKKKFKQWFEGMKDDGDVVYTELIRAGWKGSVTFDQENDCFICSLTQRDEGSRNYDICCTSRSDNMFEAMMLGVFKIVVMYPDQQLPTEAQRNNWG